MTAEFDSRRRQLLENNLRASHGEIVWKTASKLDSSLKKNTAFIKKIRTSINHDQYQAILKDISSLSLEKYLSEIITSVCEGLLKVSKHDDIVAAMEIVSGLHQRFTVQFSPTLLSTMLDSVANPARLASSIDQDPKEVALRISKQKGLIKLVTEFSMIGIFHDLGDADRDTLSDNYLKKLTKTPKEPIVFVVLKDLLNFELKSGNSLAIAQTFLKRFAYIIYDDDNDLMSPELKSTLKQMFEIYTNAVFDFLVQLDLKVVKITKRNKKASIRLGKILDEYADELDQSTQLYEKFYSSSRYFSETLNIPLPKLSCDGEVQGEELENSVIEVVKSKSLNEDELGGVWESIFEKNFYMKVPKLSDLLADETISSDTIDGEMVNEFLIKLEQVNENNLEDLVVEFNKCNLNNRATKNRLFKFFTESNDLKNFKFYAKFLKISEEPLADLIQQLIDHLDAGFRSQMFHSRMSFKIIFFFVELMKFRMISSHVIFHKIRQLTINIASTNNIDILSVFYEQGGRFLLHDDEYGELMREMVELLRQKSKDSQLTINQKLALKNILMFVDPVATKVNKIQENTIVYSPKEKFILHLLRAEMNPENISSIINLIKRTSMVQDPETIGIVLECFAHPEVINYDYIPELALALRQASRKSRPILMKTIDTIIEEIKRGLELNDYRLNRTRMAHVKFMAEIYNLQLVNFKFLNDLLYKIICCGHINNQPLPNSDLEIDSPDNFFRIQLCCLLLTSINTISAPAGKKSSSKTSAMDRKKKVNKELLETFFVFFQYYLHCKIKPIPIEVQFKIDDLFAKYASIVDVEVLSTTEEAVMRLQQIIAAKNWNKSTVDDYDDDDDDDEDEDDMDDEDDEDDDDDEDDEDDDLSDDEDVSEGETDIDSDSDIDLKFKKIELERERLKLDEEKRLAEELDKEIQRMVLDSYESNKPQQSSISRGKLGLPLMSQIPTNEKAKINGNVMSFSLLTKKGKNTNVKQLHLPSDNKFAETLMKEEESQKQYRQKIMSSVLNMDHQ
jgi:regulator of nonsense transcripts 2